MNCDTTDPEAVVEEALLTAARACSVPYRAAMSRSRNRRCVTARALAMVWASSRIGHTVEDVADALDMDHSTVVWHRGRHADRLRAEPMYQQAWGELTTELQKRTN